MRPAVRLCAVLILPVVLIAIAGCGTTRMAARPAPPEPVDLSVFVGARSVSVSPAALGAGPVRLLIASQARSALVLQLVRRGPSLLSGRRLLIAQSAPIAAGGNRQWSLTLPPGVYLLRTRGLRLSEAALAFPGPIAPARLLVAARRPSSDNALLQP